MLSASPGSNENLFNRFDGLLSLLIVNHLERITDNLAHSISSGKLDDGSVTCKKLADVIVGGLTYAAGFMAQNLGAVKYTPAHAQALDQLLQGSLGIMFKSLDDAGKVRFSVDLRRELQAVSEAVQAFSNEVSTLSGQAVPENQANSDQCLALFNSLADCLTQIRRARPN